MFARVIPALRTPVGVDAFDYTVPDGMEVRVGDLVTFPFRNRPTVGVVAECVADSPYAAKAKLLIGSYASVHLPPTFVALVRWTAARTFSSQATVVHAWLRELPRRPNSSQKPPLSPLSGGTATPPLIRGGWEGFMVDPEAELLKTARTQKGRTLIIVPWKERASRYARELDAPLLTSDTPSAAAFHQWSAFLNAKKGILITTRVGAWLACGADTVLLDEPENDDHKQDELAPRYDVRQMVAWCAHHAGIQVRSFGRTPQLIDPTPAPTINVDVTVRERQRAGRSEIPTILADTLTDLVTHDAPRIIYHPIRGMAARLRCRDCSWSAACARCSFPLSVGTHDAECRRCGAHAPMPETCPTCGSASLGASTPGIERLRAIWQAKLPETSVEWRTLSNADVEKPFPEQALVVVTDGALLAGATEDVLRLERTAIAFRRLADRVGQAQGRLIIQSDATLLPFWEPWLTSEGFSAFREQECKSRSLFGYPPAKRVVKILVDGTEADAEAWGARAKARNPEPVTQSPGQGATGYGIRDTVTLDKTWELRGPLPVAYRSSSRPSRFVWHAVVDPAVPEPDLIASLTPLVTKGVLIDLDPIAFFR